MKSCHFDNMNEPRRYYTKGDKPDRERQIPHDFTYMWSLKTTRENKQEMKRLTNIEKKSIQQQQKEKQTHKYKQTDGHQSGGDWGDEQNG